jgi:hypothetical protein
MEESILVLIIIVAVIATTIPVIIAAITISNEFNLKLVPFLIPMNSPVELVNLNQINT